MVTGIETVIWQAVITVAVVVSFALFGVAVVGWLLHRGMRKIQSQNSRLMYLLAALNQDVEALGAEMFESKRKRKEALQQRSKRHVGKAMQDLAESMIEDLEAMNEEQVEQVKRDFDGAGSP